MKKKKTKILIIEDEKDLLETIKIKLTQENFKVITATDGKVALEKIKKQKPNLILLDLMLPTISGEEILEKISKDPKLNKIPVIIISNSGQPVEIKNLLKHGAEDYIIKANFTIDDIIERIHNALEKRKGPADVLIIEDEPFLRNTLAEKLRKEKIKVLTSLDGSTALKTIHEFKPKVIALDLLMPDIDGIELLKKLKKDKNFDTKKTKIIILSNYTGKENNPIIKEMTQGYLIKSNLDIDEIIKKLKSFLNK